MTVPVLIAFTGLVFGVGIRACADGALNRDRALLVFGALCGVHACFSALQAASLLVAEPLFIDHILWLREATVIAFLGLMVCFCAFLANRRMGRIDWAIVGACSLLVLGALALAFNWIPSVVQGAEWPDLVAWLFPAVVLLRLLVSAGALRRAGLPREAWALAAASAALVAGVACILGAPEAGQPCWYMGQWALFTWLAILASLLAQLSSRRRREYEAKQERIRLSEASFRALHEGASDAFLEVDLTTAAITGWSAAALAMTGLPGDELGRCSVLDLCGSDCRTSV